MLTKSTPKSPGAVRPPVRSWRSAVGIGRTIICALLMLSLAGCGGGVQRVDLQAQAGSGQGPVEPEVLVVTLSGKLGTVELARCHRSLREAESRGLMVVFRLDEVGSQGEDVADLQSLFDRMQNSEVATVAVLRGRVTQGAAALALCARQVYCLQGAQWGEIVKPEREIGVLVDTDPDKAQDAFLDAMRSLIEARLDRRSNKLGPDARKVALAMADPRVQLVSAVVREGGLERPRVLDQAELTALQKSGASIFGEAPLTRPPVIDAEQAAEFGLSEGTLSGYDQLADVLAIDRARVGELTENWAEHMVAWLELLQPFLLGMGFLLLLVEVKTPGTGLPGILGVAFLALALTHSYLVGLAEITEILVFFLGLAAIAVELFLLPGTVVFGVTGFLCLVLSLVLSRQSFVLPSNAVEQEILFWNLANLVMLFVVVSVCAWALWRILPSVPVFNRLLLRPPGSGEEPVSNSQPSGLGIDSDRLVALVGRTGTAATVLRPTGTMALEGDRVDVVTEGEYVPAGTAVRVLYVQGNRVVVAAEDGVAAAPADPRASENGSAGVVVLLCVLGLALIFVEVILVSFGAIGFIAAGCLLGAIFVAFQESIAFGVGMSIFESIAAPLTLLFSFKVLPKTPFGKRLILNGPPTDGSAAAGDGHLGQLVGKRGRTLSALRPAGFARIDGEKVDVVTRGEMLAKDVDVVVLEVSGNRVVVGAPVGDTPPA